MQLKFFSLFFVLVFISSYTVFAQTGKEKENKTFGFFIQKPTDWIAGTREEATRNLDKLDFTDEQLSQLINSNRGTLNMEVFYKYDLNNYAGLIPTINVTLRHNPTKDFSQFKQWITASANSMNSILEEFTLIDQPKEVLVDNQRSLVYKFSYLIKPKEGEAVRVFNRYYVIPRGKYYFAISFMHLPSKEDCSKEFDEALQSIKISN